MVIKLFVTAIFTLLISGCSQQWYTEYGIPNERALTDKESLPKLIEAMQDSEPNIRINAMRQVLRFGEDAKDAIPSLISTLDDNVDNVRIYACTFVGEIWL